ncbi:Uncharacterized conserved protein [Delftia tsuruhatensis]|uniref:PAAR domain-containing protein n=1 Tax=Delftia tsuruhatensis TaxID=180282 RepID=UPI001E80C4C6|nr:PAAR domain-containing protein [Delftia tsuruhatensis]CAB5663582.1 Uncharacterized conserved protein [Delftia tsuruhatensis]CAC9677332.1 Uncharacterized conserved protein [Delftia tsuruhatensis]
MGPPAARQGDSHPEGPILEGSADILIGSQPAARLSDKVGHRRGTETITEGEPTVLFNGRPAARMGDMVACGEVITSGCGTVFIGKSHGQCLVQAAESGQSLVTDL